MKKSYRKSKTLMRQKRRRKRILQRIKFVCNFSITCILFGILIFLVKALIIRNLPWKDTSSNPFVIIDDYIADYSTGNSSISSESNVIVNTQSILTNAELEARLTELALENKEIAEIYADKDIYPEKLLAALANNQELVEFVKGYPDADGTVKDGLRKDEEEQEFPLFLQWDQRWGYVPYGGSCIGIAGCGPTCLSMVIFSLTRDSSATPDALAAYSMNHGFYTEGVGTDWLFMTDAAAQYGIHATELGLDEAVMKQYLDQGHPIICALRPGDFTTTGHFIMLYGYDEKGFMVNDPNSRERSNRRWDFETLHYQIKNLWGYS